MTTTSSAALVKTYVSGVKPLSVGAGAAGDPVRAVLGMVQDTHNAMGASGLWGMVARWSQGSPVAHVGYNQTPDAFNTLADQYNTLLSAMQTTQGWLNGTPAAQNTPAVNGLGYQLDQIQAALSTAATQVDAACGGQSPTGDPCATLRTAMTKCQTDKAAYFAKLQAVALALGLTADAKADDLVAAVTNLKSGQPQTQTTSTSSGYTGGELAAAGGGGFVAGAIVGALAGRAMKR